MSGPNGHEHAGRTRFQVASRLGGFKDNVTLSDPFNTGALFTIIRKGSAKHREWAKQWLESDPMTAAMLEEQILGEDVVVITAEEQEVIKAARVAASNEVEHLLAIIDRVVGVRTEMDRTRIATRKALDSGRVTLADLATDTLRVLHDRQEALFLLKGWEKLLDAEGAEIPYSPEVAEELLLNDTPLDGTGLDDLLLSIPCWRLEVKDYAEDGTETGSHFIPRTDPVLLRLAGPQQHFTLGRAYQLWFHWASEQSAHFRDQLVEEVAKNSETPSDPIILSGGGTSTEASS